MCPSSFYFPLPSISPIPDVLLRWLAFDTAQDVNSLSRFVCLGRSVCRSVCLSVSFKHGRTHPRYPTMSIMQCPPAGIAGIANVYFPKHSVRALNSLRIFPKQSENPGVQKTCHSLVRLSWLMRVTFHFFRVAAESDFLEAHLILNCTPHSHPSAWKSMPTASNGNAFFKTEHVRTTQCSMMITLQNVPYLSLISSF